MDTVGCDNEGESVATLKGAVFYGQVDEAMSVEKPGVNDEEYCWTLCDARDEAYLEEFGYHGCNLAMFWEGDRCDLHYIPQDKWNSGDMKVDSTGATAITSKVFCREAWCGPQLLCCYGVSVTDEGLRRCAHLAVSLFVW